MLPLAAPTSARLRTCPNQWAPVLLGSLVCPGTREGVPPRTRYAAIIIAAARVAAPIVPFHAVPDQTISRRVLPGADLGLRALVPPLAKNPDVSNRGLKDNLPSSELET